MKDGGYKRLKDRCARWINRARYPDRKAIFQIPKARLDESWNLSQTAAQLRLAQSLGWEGRLRVLDDGSLECEVIKLPGEAPL